MIGYHAVMIRNKCIAMGTWPVRAGLGLLLLVMAVQAVSAGQTVAVFDIGSGSTRMLVAEVDACNGDLLTVRDRRSVRLSFAADLLESGAGRFSEEIKTEASSVMAELVELARGHGAEILVGIATQAFRSADNGSALLAQWQEELELVATVVTQEEEARLAFRFVASQLDDVASRLLVWDIGAGSQQLVWREPATRSWHHVNSDLASVSFRNRAMVVLGRPAGSRTPNPIDPEEVAHLVAELAQWLDADKAAAVAAVVSGGFEVVGIGGVHGASLVNQLGLAPGDDVTRSGVARALHQRLGLDDEEIGGDYADTDVTNLILVATLMDRFGIERYRIMGLDLTEALLLALAGTCPCGDDGAAAVSWPEPAAVATPGP
ncbi:MAG: hypothetical protein EA370_01505 [Wenzhouxiangella sp.]|nr:MAG: hypothetical protein EA370_01505 [Wenzhouxiangella sp.]